MKTYKASFFSALLLLVASALLELPAAAHQRSNGEVIIEYNQLLQQNLGGGPIAMVRYYAMLHIAMADAVVAIEGRYSPYHVRVWAPRGASSEAAAARAGHDILAALVPSGLAAYDAAFSRLWAGIHYRMDLEESQVSCTQVADYLFDHYMRPRGRDH